MVLTIDEVQDVLEEIAEELPEWVYDELNGGILLLPDEMVAPEAVDNDLFTLGEYVYDDIMGRYVVLYYGSFCALFAGEPEEIWRSELKETLRHELTHHFESLAGERGLEIKDEEELKEYFSEMGL